MDRNHTRATIYLTLMILVGLLLACNISTPAPGDETLTPVPPPTEPAAGPTAPLPSPLPTSGGCQAYSPDFAFVTGATEVYPVPSLAEPAPRQWFTDPVFGTCLVRVTDRARDPVSRRRLSPGSRTSTRGCSPSTPMAAASWCAAPRHCGTCTTPRRSSPWANCPLEDEPRWDADDPDLLYYSDETRLMAYDVRDRRAEPSPRLCRATCPARTSRPCGRATRAAPRATAATGA